VTGITTYSGLTAKLETWLDRDDLDADVDTFIQLTEARLNRLLEDPDMEVSTTLTGDGASLPADFGSMVSIGTADGYPLAQMGNEEYSAIRPCRAFRAITRSAPARFTTCPGSANPTLIYRRKIPALTSTNTTNWLLDPRARRLSLRVPRASLRVGPGRRSSGRVEIVCLMRRWQRAPHGRRSPQVGRGADCAADQAPMKLVFGDFLPDLPNHGTKGVSSVDSLYPTSGGYRPVGQWILHANALPTACRGAAAFVAPSGRVVIIAGTATKLYRQDGLDWLEIGTGYTLGAESQVAVRPVRSDRDCHQLGGIRSRSTLRRMRLRHWAERRRSSRPLPWSITSWSAPRPTARST
jgi:hypothetical protein